MSGMVDQSADARSKTIGQNFRVRAWVNYSVASSAGTCTIRNSGNVSSVTRNTNTGDTTVNFVQKIPDKFAAGYANYDGNSGGTRGGGTMMFYDDAETDSGTSARFLTFYQTGVFGTVSGGAGSNTQLVSIIFVA